MTVNTQDSAQIAPTFVSMAGSVSDHVELPLVKADLLQLSMSTAPEALVRQHFREITLRHTKGVGVFHATRNHTTVWEVHTTYRTGRVPGDAEFAQVIGEVCEQVTVRNRVQVKRLENFHGCQALFMPVQVFGAKPEVFVVLLPGKLPIARPLTVATAAVQAFCLWLKVHAKTKDEWKLSSLAAIIDLVSRVEDCRSVDECASLIVNEMSRKLGADVAVGWLGRRSQLAAISGVVKLDQNSDTARHYSQVIQESRLRVQPGVYPPEGDSNDELLLAHKQLAAWAPVDCVRSQPLIGKEGEAIGTVVVAGSEEAVATYQTDRLLAAAAPRLASAVECVRRGQRSKIVRGVQGLRRRFRQVKFLMIWLLLLGVIAIMFVPVTYKVRCNAVVEPKEKRFAVAPFDGLVESSFVEAGDSVRRGQLLAQLDGRSIRWELAGVIAERQAAKKRSDVEIVEQNVSRAMLQDLEQQRLEAKEHVLNDRSQSLKIQSPIDGIVLRGSEEFGDSASVSTGDLLFELASLDSLVVEVEIPSDEMAQVAEGMPVTVWIEGHEHQSVQGSLRQIRPRSEIRNAANVFVAEVEVPKNRDDIRPGMKASARIDGPRRPLGWALFHKPYSYIVTRWVHW